MSKPINNDKVVHEGSKSFCPDCHQQVFKKKYTNLRTGESYWKWTHVNHQGTSMEVHTDKCPLNETSTGDKDFNSLPEYHQITKQEEN